MQAPRTGFGGDRTSDLKGHICAEFTQGSVTKGGERWDTSYAFPASARTNLYDGLGVTLTVWEHPVGRKHRCVLQPGHWITLVS